MVSLDYIKGANLYYCKTDRELEAYSFKLTSFQLDYRYKCSQ